MSTKSKTVLMIGGPADGRWMVSDLPEIICVEPPAFDWKKTMEDPAPFVGLRQVRYYVETCFLFDRRFKVAVAQSEFRSIRDRDNAVIRALFQRDVAEAMGAFR